MWREMGRSGTLHACRGDRQMAVGGLAEPSRNIKPLIPAPTWPVLTSTILVPPPLARRVLAAVTGPHASTAVYVFKRYRPIYSCNEPFRALAQVRGLQRTRGYRQITHPLSC